MCFIKCIMSCVVVLYLNNLEMYNNIHMKCAVYLCSVLHLVQSNNYFNANCFDYKLETNVNKA